MRYLIQTLRAECSAAEPDPWADPKWDLIRYTLPGEPTAAPPPVVHPLTVTINEPQEFLAELVRDLARIDDAIVRVTRAYHRTESPLHLVYLVAGYTVDGRVQLVELVACCGEQLMMPTGSSEQHPTTRRANAIRDRIADNCERLGLEMRGGYFTRGRDAR